MMGRFKGFIVISFFLISCIPKPEAVQVMTCRPEDVKTSTALFEVAKVSARVIEKPSKGPIPSQFTLSFEACIYDANKFTKTTLPGADFQILTYNPFSKTDNKEKTSIQLFRIPEDLQQKQYIAIRRTTGANGCLQWQETYNYPVPTKNQWIYFERTFKNAGGQVVVPLIVNPWLHSVSESDRFYDVRPKYNDVKEITDSLYKMAEDPSAAQKGREDSVQKCLMSRSLTHIFDHLKEKGKAVLYANEINIVVTYPSGTPPKEQYKIKERNVTYLDGRGGSESRGLFLDLQLEIPLKFMSENIGVVKPQPVEQGRFQVTPMLIARVGDQIKRLHRDIKPAVESVISGDSPLRVHFPYIHIPYDHSTASFELYLKVEAVGEGADNIKPLYRVYSIPHSNISSLGGRQRLTPISLSAEEESSSFSALESEGGAIEEYAQDNKRYAVRYNNVNGAGGEDLFAKKESPLRPHPSEGFYEAGDLSVVLERMRFFAVYNDRGQGVCESVVQREVVWTGSVTIQDLKKQGDKNLSNYPVDVYVQEYEINDQGKLDCVKKEGLYARHGESAAVGSCKQQTPIQKGGKTLTSGELQFRYKISHKVYDTQRFFIRKFIFRFSQQYKPVEKMVVFVPWEYGFLTYQDVTGQWEAEKQGQEVHYDVPLENILDADMDLPPPALRLDQYGVMLIEPSYTVSDSLDINTIKNLMVVLRPTITRFDSQARTIRAAPFALPRGYYLLRMILLKGPQEGSNGRRKIVSSDMRINPVRRLQSFFEGSEYSQLYDRYFSLFQKRANSAESMSSSNFEEFKTDISRMDNEIINVLSKDNVRANAFRFRKAGICLNEEFNPNCGKPYQAEDYISHYDTLAYSENGAVNAFVNFELSTEKFRHLGSRNIVIIQVYPTDPKGYKYLSDESGSKTCRIDILNSQWRPYTDHDLVNTPHWGLSSFSGQGAFNRVHPMDESLLASLIRSEENPEAPLLPLEEEFSGKASEEIQQALKYARSKLDAAENIPSDWDLDLSQDRFKEYCSGTTPDEEESSHLRACLCFERKGSRDEWNSELSYRTRPPSRETVQACKLLAQKLDRLDNIQSHFQEINPVENMPQDRKRYCEASTRGSSNSYNGGESDVSEDGKAFRECVCSNTSQDSLTLAMAQCFAKNQGVQVIEVAKDSRFLKDLNQVDEFFQYNAALAQKIIKPLSGAVSAFVSLMSSIFGDDEAESGRRQNDQDHLEYMNYTQVMGEDALAGYKLQNLSSISSVKQQDLRRFIKEGVQADRRNQPEERSFLHLMCYFWFDKYYKNFFDAGQISSMYDFHRRNEFILEGQAVNAEGVSQSSSLRLRFGQLRQLQQNPFSEPGVSWSIKMPYMHFASPLLPFIYTGAASGKLPNQHPYYRCLKNPLYFFHFERKVMVGKMSDRPGDVEYQSGHVYSFITNEVQSADMREGWGIRSQFSVGSEVKASLGAVIGVGTRASAEKSISDTHERSKRKGESSVASVTLAVNQVNIQLGFEQYRQCLLIRPKRAAFKGYGDEIWSSHLGDAVQSVISGGYSKNQEEFIQFAYKYFGLLLCDEEVNDSDQVLHVDESYYYIHQFFAGHYEFMSRTIYHNRPFVQLIRGKHSMDKFETLVKGEDYKLWNGEMPGHLNLKQRSVDHNLIQAFEETRLDWAGFMEGIYTHSSPNDHYLFSSDRQDAEPSASAKFNESLLEKLDDWFDWSSERKVPKMD